MTNEEAISILKHCGAELHCYDYIHGHHCEGCNQRIAQDMAIDALKREERMRAEKEVADDIAKMCFRKSIEKQKESYDLLNFDCKEVSNFVRGEAFAYGKMNEWIQGYILTMCESDEDRKEE